MVTEVNQKLIMEAHDLITEAIQCQDEICARKTAIQIVEMTGTVILAKFNKYALERIFDEQVLSSISPTAYGIHLIKIDTLEFAQKELRRIVEAL